MKKVKALVLLSGGLDSLLAAKILLEQNIQVVGLVFKSYFFDEKEAKKYAKQLKIPLKVINIGKEHLKIVKNPKYGYGKGMNPCIDCHLLMLKKAKEVMEKEKFDFVATGEVLEERPFSQSKKALELIEEESSLKGYLLRPLSAKLLPKTIPEEKGWVKREKLFGIRGKRRKKQIELAKKFGLEYPQPSGGCILTDLTFSKKLKELLEVKKNIGKNDVELLKVGRHFWFDGIKVVLGRNEKENKKLEKLAKKEDVLVKPKFPGPTALIRVYKGELSKTLLQKVKRLIKNYAKKAKLKSRFEIVFV